jgi:hypothetical protein
LSTRPLASSTTGAAIRGPGPKDFVKRFIRLRVRTAGLLLQLGFCLLAQLFQFVIGQGTQPGTFRTPSPLRAAVRHTSARIAVPPTCSGHIARRIEPPGNLPDGPILLYATTPGAPLHGLPTIPGRSRVPPDPGTRQPTPKKIPKSSRDSLAFLARIRLSVHTG